MLFSSVIAATLIWTVSAQGADGILLEDPAAAVDEATAINIDTATLPTFLVVATGSVPDFTGTIPSLFQPTITAEAVTGYDEGRLLQESSLTTVSDSTTEERVTEITTTLLTVANGSTTPVALTTTVPVSLGENQEDQGSASRSSHLYQAAASVTILLAVQLLN